MSNYTSQSVETTQSIKAKVDVESMSASDLSQFISANPHYLDSCSRADMFNILQKINPYCQVVSDVPQKTVLFSITNWKEEYLKKWKAVSLVKFLDRMVSEYQDIAAKLEVDTDKVEENKKVITQFFDYVMKYDPEQHTRSSYQGKAQGDKSREDVSEQQKTQLPSLDVYERWARFEESNATEIKRDVQNFYSVRPDLQYAIQIYDVFPDDSSADAFRDKHGPALSVDMIKAQTNKWIILENTEATVEKTKFYDKENEVLENMIAQMKKDAEIGQQMLTRRKQEMTDKNTKENGGVDKESLKTYIDDMGQQIRATKQELFGMNQGGIMDADQYPVFVNTGANKLEKEIR